MTYPTSPPTAFDYVTFQAGNPTDPLPATDVAGDFANHKLSIDQIINFAKLIQRSDGNLQNGSVRPETLSSGVLSLLPVGVVFKGAWLTATAYVPNNIVSQSGNNYICLVGHTSGTFATDLAAGDWQLIDAGKASLSADQTFTGHETFSGTVTATGAVDMTGGTPTVPTASPGDNDTSAASTAFVVAALAVATGKVKIQLFTTVGANTYTPSTGMVNALGFTWGGGGGGGGTASTTSPVISSGAGGGAGSLSIKLMTAAAIGASKTVTIGAAGTGGTAGNNVGGAGGDTSIGSLCIGKGGSGGAGSAGGASGGALSIGGAGGVAGTGDVTTTGAPGASTVGGTAFAASGAGGSSLVGGGATGAIAASGTATGNAGSGRASGGSGGVSIGSSGTAAGGAGTLGYCFIIEFCSQ